MNPWFRLNSVNDLPTPSLLIYPERIKSNIDEMIRLAGTVDRLRPHVKTHKCPEIVSMQLKAGITKFKCATVAEAEMLAACGVGDIVIAYQLTGGNLASIFELQKIFPEVRFAALTDDLEMVKETNKMAGSSQGFLNLLIDLDVGMHRTGVSSLAVIRDIYKAIKEAPNLDFGGWHIYDGHIRDFQFAERQEKADAAYATMEGVIKALPSAEIIVGGSPTFPNHASREGVTLSPGTALLWDHGYRRMLPDLSFKPAALLTTRVISKPGGDLLCLDLGHKALASEMPHPRIHLLGIEVLEFTVHSEEHMVIRTAEAPSYQVGDLLYGVPVHICPTVALHENLLVVEDREIIDQWRVAARNRRCRI